MRRRRRLIIGVVAVLIVLVAAATVYVVHVYRQSQEVYCAANLRSTGQSLWAYADEHDGELPASWEELLEYVAPDNLVCPLSSDSAVSSEATLAEKVAWIRSGRVSYVYLGAGLRWKELTPQTMLAVEKEARHGGKRAVLLGDGHVDFLEMDLPVGANARAVSRPATRPGM